MVPHTVANLSRIGATVTIKGSSTSPNQTPKALRPVGVAIVAATADSPAMMLVAMAICSTLVAITSWFMWIAGVVGGLIATGFPGGSAEKSPAF